MDIPRPSDRRAKRFRRIAYGSWLFLLLGGTTLGLSRLRPAPPTVDRATIYTDTVKRGEMIREVRGIGTSCRWIFAGFRRSLRLAWTRSFCNRARRVKPDSVILELSDPQLQRDVLDAEYAYKAAEADLANLKAQLANNLMTQKSAAAVIESDYQQAKLQAEADRQLASQGLRANIVAEKSAVAARAVGHSRKTRPGTIQRCGRRGESASRGAAGPSRAAACAVRAKESQLDALHVRAGLSGVLSAVSVEIGQQVTPGTNLVRVADPTHLKATMQIPETQAKDVVIGQKRVSRHAQRRGAGPRDSSRCRRRERHGGGGREPRRGAAARRASGPQRGRHHRDR